MKWKFVFHFYFMSESNLKWIFIYIFPANEKIKMTFELNFKYKTTENEFKIENLKKKYSEIDFIETQICIKFDTNFLYQRKLYKTKRESSD